VKLAYLHLFIPRGWNLPQYCLWSLSIPSDSIGISAKLAVQKMAKEHESWPWKGKVTEDNDICIVWDLHIFGTHV
jgi:hypothetical protein